MDNLTEEQKKKAHELIDLIDDAVTELDRWSVQNDDIMATPVYGLIEKVKDCRKQLL